MLGWVLNLGFGGSSEGEAPAPEVERRTGRSRRKVRYIVEVDGQPLVASTIAEAESILLQARELAKESAPQDARKSAARIKPPRVSVRTASGAKTTSQVLQRSVSTTQQTINAIYRRAHESIEREREISRLLQDKLRRQDDEEAVSLLLL